VPALKKLTRDALNDKALKLGITDAVEMPNRAAVIEAIEEAKAAPPGARVLSVFGNGLRVLVEMHVDRAREEFGAAQLVDAGRTDVVDATEQELAALRKVSAEVADSALAAAALRMAFEIDHPYNSATAKANCVSELHKVMDKLRELAAEDGEAKAKAGSKVDELRERRAKRRAAP
jgi:hypothetical protein